MKYRTKQNLKTFLLGITYTLFIAFIGISIIFLVLDFGIGSIFLFAITVLGSIFMALIYTVELNHYQWKYLLLGKDFKQKLKDYLKDKKLSDDERKKLIKQLKSNYRKSGRLNIAMISEVITPNKLWYEDYYAFSYGNALEEQKLEFLVGLLHEKCESGGGFYRFFETLAEQEPFEYDELYRLIKNNNIFSKELTQLLLTSKFKKVFELQKNYKNCTEEDHKFLQDFELGDSNLIYDYQFELFDLVEKFAIKNYLELKRYYDLPENTCRLFYSKDGRQRAGVFFDVEHNVYKNFTEDFLFYSTEQSLLYSDGGWIGQYYNSIFESQELALNELKLQITDFIEEDINKIKNKGENLWLM